jgi:DNA-binding transcriptional MerR regulator
MRIKELIEITGTSRQAIHYYIREGLLPRPKKTSRNQAEYNQDHIDRIQQIKELHEQFFLPLATIKKIFRAQKSTANGRSILKAKTEYFKPLDQFLPQETHGEEKFLEITGVSPNRLKDFERWEIIEPKCIDGQKVYSHHDLTIGRVIGQMRKLGISYEEGFHSAGLRDLRDMFRSIVSKMGEEFDYGVRSKITRENFDELGEIFIEVMAVFFYHLCHRLLREEIDQRLKVIKSEPGEG